MSGVYVPGRIIVLGVAGGLQVMTSTPLVDPSSSGVAAPVGSIYLGSGTLYVKTGAGDTAWSSTLTPTTSPKIQQQLKTPKYDGANGTVSLGTNGARAMFLGYAYRDFVAGEAFAVRWRNAVAGSGVTWAEVALGTGPLVEGSNPSVTPVGFADISAGIVATNTNFTTSVPIAVGRSIAANAGLWLIFAKNSTGSPTLAAGGAFDVLGSGIQGTSSTVAWRPSLQLGTAESFTIDTATLPIMGHVVAP